MRTALHVWQTRCQQEAASAIPFRRKTADGPDADILELPLPISGAYVSNSVGSGRSKFVRPQPPAKALCHWFPLYAALRSLGSPFYTLITNLEPPGPGIL